MPSAVEPQSASGASGPVRRLVLASSMVVYGEGADRCPVDSPVRPPPRSAARPTSTTTVPA
jgi:dTDP-L-rhamnose 4-epimerase